MSDNENCELALVPRRAFVRRRHRITVWGNILDPYGHDVTAAKLAIDGQIKQGKVTYSLLQ